MKKPRLARAFSDQCPGAGRGLRRSEYLEQLPAMAVLGCYVALLTSSVPA